MNNMSMIAEITRKG